ncbi:MAG: lamin tail domain-containing protein [Deltaproteobacteria bacterium]|nr:lamin tail domain-containing protein [Deltaproteobacteria bacterium]
MLSCLPILLGACATPTLLINEFMADNVSTVANTRGEYADWIEFCNPGAEPVSLGGHFLSDSLEDPLRFALPASWQVPAEGHLLLWAVGAADEEAFSVPFRISASGESLLLAAEAEDGGVEILDQVRFGAQDPDTSVARSPDCQPTWIRSESPSPGLPNP